MKFLIVLWGPTTLILVRGAYCTHTRLGGSVNVLVYWRKKVLDRYGGYMI